MHLVNAHTHKKKKFLVPEKHNFILGYGKCQTLLIFYF